ncbi:MAG: PilZ domain-containing protein [Burkholderiales bacterium]|nr:PilZ domain-containing protein [Burkholderiales bacterium]
MEASQGEQEDRREAPRARLRLRVAIAYPEHEGRPAQPIYHAKTHDICMSGLSMVVEDNVFHEGAVTLTLALPPEHSWAPQKDITVTARMTYAIRSSKLNGFKIGMTFLEFKGEAKELLQAAILREIGEADDPGNGNSGVDSGS